MLMLLDGILVLSGLSCKRQRISVLYAREGIGDIVYSNRQSQLHMDLEVYMREDDDHRGLLQRLKLATMAMELVLGMAILPCDQERGIHENPTRDDLRRAPWSGHGNY